MELRGSVEKHRSAEVMGKNEIKPGWGEMMMISDVKKLLQG